jgi:hypothetical protein
MTKNATAPKNETLPAVLLMKPTMSNLPPPNKAQHCYDHDQEDRQHKQ